ncbi:MAG: trypsin-like peptidase domain-containing protein [Bacteroidota bacterium]
MKNTISLIFAGVIGGMIALGGVYFMMPAPAVQTPADLSFARMVDNNTNVNPRTKAVPYDFTAAANKAMPAVVHISSVESNELAQQRRNDEGRNNPFRQFFGDDFFGGPQKKGSGSGVIISNDGFIVTNNHVVEFADEVEVTLYDNRAFMAKVIGTNPQTDLAVLKIDADRLPTLEFADSDAAQVGEWVLAVGNPFDLTSTVTAGIISAKGRNINIINSNTGIESFIQTDAAVNPGNSGGALVDAEGRLLGINTAIATQTGSYAGYSFAIPINMASKIVDDLIQYGEYKRAFIGVQISNMDNELAEELDVDITQGVYVSSLVQGGAAEYAGILPKDIITEVDGRLVKSVPELQEVVGRAKVGDTITLTVVRRGKTQEIPVTLKEG